MAKGRYWYKRRGADFVMATIGFPSSDHKWAYSAIIDMLNDRDRPLADDPGFICGFTGLSKQKWASVRRFLFENEYLVAAGDGYLTNPQFERERAERSEAHDQAVRLGREGGRKSAAIRQGSLDLEDEPPARARVRDEAKGPRKVRDNREKIAEKSPTLSGPSDGRPLKSGEKIEPPPQAPYAREEAREESNTTLPDPSPRLDDDASADRAGLGREVLDRIEDEETRRLYALVARTSGHAPVGTTQFERAVRFVERWRADGIGFDEVVIPTIRRMVAESADETRTLGRFDKAIRHAHAKADARSSLGKPETPEPVLEPEGEDERFRKLRRALLERMGPFSYAMIGNRTTFEVVEDAGAGRRPVRVTTRGPSKLMDTEWAGLVRAAARSMGFTDVW